MGVDQLAHKLTMAGLEVDSVYDRYGNLSTVLVGRIISVKPHPRADKLKLCAVEAGSDHPLPSSAVRPMPSKACWRLWHFPER
jgi:phenylalanyl-tRNA synthetase beta chain